MCGGRQVIRRCVCVLCDVRACVFLFFSGGAFVCSVMCVCVCFVKSVCVCVV